MRQRYTVLMAAASMLLLLIAVGQSMLTMAPAAQAQTGGGAAPLPTIILDMSPVAGAIREQGAQMVQAAQAQGASVARLADIQSTSVVQLITAQAANVAQLVNAQATSVAQLLQEAQAQRTAMAEQSGTAVAGMQALGQRLANCTVTGTGYVEVRAKPDSATAQVDIKSLALTLDDALKDNAAKVAAARQQLQGYGLAAGAVSAMSPQVAPVLGDDRAITAYRVLTPLQVTVPTPSSDSGSAVLAQVLALGGSSFKDVTFSTTDPTSFEKDARAQAFAKAKAQAAEYAQMAQGQLGAIISVSEDVNSRREPLIPGLGQPTVPIYNAQVSVVFAFVGPCGLPTALTPAPVGR
jgi:uncharacterized protein YggE